MLANWVKETASATGAPFTANITLDGAETGRVAFSDQFATSDLFYYAIEDGDDKESGIGHLSASTTLVRDTVLETLVSGTFDNTSPTAISVGSGAFIYCSGLAQNLIKPLTESSNGIVGYLNLNTELTGISFGSTNTGRMYMSPVFVTFAGKVDGFVTMVGTAAGTSSDYLRLALYAPDAANNYPGTLLGASVDIDPSTTGEKRVAFTSGGTVKISPGWYWIGTHCNVAATVPRIHGGMPAIEGLVSPRASDWRRFRFRGDSTFSGTFADNPTTSWSDDNGFMFFLRIAS